MTIDGIKVFISDLSAAIAILDSRRLLKWIPDSLYLRILYYLKMKKKLDLENPKYFTEKLQWLKLYDRKPEYTLIVDKYAVRQFVAERVGEEYLVPLVGGPWNSFDEINFDILPQQFVLKTNHDCGGIVICRDKEKLNKVEAEKILKKHLRRNYFYGNREWPYKNVSPKIIAEEYLVDESGTELKDYKFFAFDGMVKAVFVATDRYAETETCFDFYDENFRHLPFTNGHPNANIAPSKPDNYDEMLKLAKKLSQGFPHVRVDLYNVNGKLFFGELTLYHWSGMVPFEPEQWDEIMGSWMTLPDKEN